MYIAYYTQCNMGKNIMSKNGEKSLQKWTILMLLLRNLPVHSIIRVSKLPLFGTNFMLLTLYSHPFFQHLHLAISYRFFSYIHTYKNSHGKGKFPRINSFILFFWKNATIEIIPPILKWSKNNTFLWNAIQILVYQQKKNSNYIIIEFHFPKFYEDSISIFIVFRMRCGGCFLSKLFKSSLIVLTAERSQKLLIENSKFGNNDLFYRNIFHSKWRKYTLFRLPIYWLLWYGNFKKCLYMESKL